jgi:hypothetical protein
VQLLTAAGATLLIRVGHYLSGLGDVKDFYGLVLATVMTTCLAEPSALVRKIV